MKQDVFEYVQENGNSPYRKWFDRLPAQAAAKVAIALLRMEMGNLSAVKWFEGMGEYRIHWGSGLQIYLARDGDTVIVLLGGGDKSSQQADIIKAKKLLAEFRCRKTKQKQR